MDWWTKQYNQTKKAYGVISLITTDVISQEFKVIRILQLLYISHSILIL